MKTSRVPEIVLIEDDFNDELLSLKGISSSGVSCSVTVRRDASEFFDHLLSTQDSLPNLIVLDHHLPTFTGLEVLGLRRMSHRISLIPLVVLSCVQDQVLIAECYKVGVNSCVVKPVNPQEHMELLCWITRYWLTVNEVSNQLLRA